MFTYISYDFKSELHFYISVRSSGWLIQADYVIILKSVIILNYDEN
jgi:hypothetical protein